MLLRSGKIVHRKLGKPQQIEIMERVNVEEVPNIDDRLDGSIISSESNEISNVQILYYVEMEQNQEGIPSMDDSNSQIETNSRENLGSQKDKEKGNVEIAEESSINIGTSERESPKQEDISSLMSMMKELCKKVENTSREMKQEIKDINKNNKEMKQDMEKLVEKFENSSREMKAEIRENNQQMEKRIDKSHKVLSAQIADCMKENRREICRLEHRIDQVSEIMHVEVENKLTSNNESIESKVEKQIMQTKKELQRNLVQQGEEIREKVGKDLTISNKKIDKLEESLISLQNSVVECNKK